MAIKGLLACIAGANQDPTAFTRDVANFYAGFDVPPDLQTVVNRAGSVPDPTYIRDQDKEYMLSAVWQEIGQHYGLSADPVTFKKDLNSVLAHVVLDPGEAALQQAIEAVAQNRSLAGVRADYKILIRTRIWEGFLHHHPQLW